MPFNLRPALALVGLFLVATGGSADRDQTEARLRARLTSFSTSRFESNLRHDAALSDAARQHSEVLATNARVDTHEFLRQSLSHAGVLDPFPYVFYGSGPPSRLGEIENRLRTQLLQFPESERRLYTHFGIGSHTVTRRRFLRVEREIFVTVLLTQRSVTFAPLPAVFRPGDHFVFEGEIHAPFTEPQILLTQPDGNTLVLENAEDDAYAFRTHVVLGDQPGEYQLEIMGRYDQGPRVLALCSLFPRQSGEPLPYERVLAAARNGTLEPARVLPAASPDETEAEAERTLLQLVNRDRHSAGLPPLVEAEELSRLARAHSNDMRDGAFFAHVSPQNGRLRDRADRMQLRYRRLGENIAVGADVHEAERALMRSPGHRMNLLDPDFTHLGVGVAFEEDATGNRRVYVTQNFMIPAGD